MSATLRHIGDAAAIETLAVWQASPGAFFAIGRTSGRLPKAGSARAVTVPGGLGVFRAESWPLMNEAQFGFAIVVRLPGAGALMGDIALRGSRSADKDLRLHLCHPASEDMLGAQLATLAQSNAANVTRFLLEAMDGNNTGDRRHSSLLLQAFLGHAARPDGCVELLLAVSDERLILQGWGDRLAEPVAVVSTLGGTLTYAAELGEFGREDVKLPSTGAALFLNAEAARGVIGSETLFLLSADQLVARRVVDPRVVSGPESLGQLRHLFPRLTCSPRLEDEIRTLLLPRYEGRETLSAADKPVRAAVDLAVASSDAGAYLCGWIFDPAHHIESVELFNAGRSDVLDGALVPIERDDVVDAFAGDNRLPRLQEPRCGFAVTSSLPIDAAEPTYLRFTFTDGALAFLPLSIMSFDSAGVVSRLVDSVDSHKRSAATVVANALAPFIKRASSRGSAALSARTSLETSCPNVLVVPLEKPILPRSLLSSLICQGPGDDEALIFVCGPDWDDRMRHRLLALTLLYGISAEILSVPSLERPLQALLQTVRRLPAEKLLLVSPDVSLLSAAVRSRLYAELDGCDIVCPTILYEDGSIRFAGSARISVLRTSPFAELKTDFAGMPPSNRILATRVGMAGGSLACCGLTGAALAALGHQWPYFTASKGEAAFFDKADRLGLRTAWKSDIRVVVPDEGRSASTVRDLVDGWILRDECEAERCAS